MNVRNLMLAGGVAIATLAGCGSESAEPTVEETSATLSDAHTECSARRLGDDDATLMIDTEGSRPRSGLDDLDGLACVLFKLDTPDSVVGGPSED